MSSTWRPGSLVGSVTREGCDDLVDVEARPRCYEVSHDRFLECSERIARLSSGATEAKV